MTHHAPAPRDRGEALLAALADDSPSPDAVDALWRAARAWLACSGSVPLERCARLPTSPSALRRASRDLWLRHAATLVHPPGQRLAPLARRLELELSTLTGPAWTAARELEALPSHSSQLRQALFRVAKLNNGESLSDRQISRIIDNR